MNAHEMFDDDYDLLVEEAIEVFYSKSEFSEQDFIDACQILVDSGVWLMDSNICETCLFLMELGNLFLPEEDQMLPDGEHMIVGTPRKNVVN